MLDRVVEYIIEYPRISMPRLTMVGLDYARVLIRYIR